MAASCLLANERHSVEVTANLPVTVIEVRFEVFTALAMKNPVLCDVTPCGPCKIRIFGGKYPSIIRVTRIVELGTTLAIPSHWNTLR
jgi:hypothetical protein